MALFGSSGGEQELTIVIRARNEAERVLKAAEESVKKFKKSNEEMLKDVAKAGAVASAAFIAFGVAAVKAAGDAQVQMAKFNTILDNSVGANDAVREAILKHADAAKQLGFDNEAAAVSIAGLYQRTGDLNKSLELNAFAMDLARAKNIGLEEATKAVQMVLSGNARVLKEYGIELDETKAPIEALAEAQEKLKGSAQGFSETFQGQIQVFQQEFGDLMEEIGSAFLPALTSLVRAITPVIAAITTWVKENPRLTSTILITAGALSIMVTVASSIALILPKIISAVRGLTMAFFAMNAALFVWAAIGAAIAVVAYQFTKFADEVGGFGRAWSLWTIDMAAQFWSFAYNVLTAIDHIAGYIPGFGQVLDGTLNEISSKIAGLNADFYALANEGFVEMTKKGQEMGANVPAAFTQVAKSAEDAAKKIEDANTKIAETEKRITDLKKAYLGELIDAKTQYAQAFVEQEEKIKDLQMQIGEEQDSEAREKLRNQLARETQALEERRVLEQLLGTEINEERRRAGLTDFAREVEDIQKRVLAKTGEFTEKMALLQKELVANQMKRDELGKIEAQVTTNVLAEAKAREVGVIASIQPQIKAYNDLAAAAAKASSASFVPSNSFGGMANSTPAFIAPKKKAFGGLIPGPEGTEVPIIAHAGERIIPARTVAQERGGNSYTVIINNPQAPLENNEYYRVQLENALRDVSRIHKLTTV